MASRWEAQKQSVLQTSMELIRKGLVVGTAGNVSARLSPSQELLAITPSHRYYEDLSAQDIQIIDFQGDPVEGDLIPSVETMLHVAAYRARPSIGAVVHTHSTYASALSVAHLALPAVLDELVAFVGGDVRVTTYAFPSTEELAQNAASELKGRNATLLANHGVVGVGEDLRDALAVCEMVERAAHIYILARALGEVHPLPEAVLALEMELFRMARLQENR